MSTQISLMVQVIFQSKLDESAGHLLRIGGDWFWIGEHGHLIGIENKPFPSGFFDGFQGNALTGSLSVFCGQRYSGVGFGLKIEWRALYGLF